MGASGIAFQGPDGTTYNAYIFALGSSTPGVAITASTTAPTSSPSLVHRVPGLGGKRAVRDFPFRHPGGAAIRVLLPGNPSGPFTFNIKLADNSGTPVIQQGLLYLQVWDVALQRNKWTLLTIDCGERSGLGNRREHPAAPRLHVRAAGNVERLVHHLPG